MENKYSRLQISIHWLVFLLVIAAYCAMEFLVVSSHVAIGHSSTWFANHCGISISRADGGSSFVKTEIPYPADYT